EGDPEVDRLAVRDAALDAARSVRARPDATAFHVEFVVVLRATEIGPREARADLETLARRQAHHGLRKIGFEAIEDRLAPPRRTSAHGAHADATERVTVLSRRLDRRDHLLGHREIWTADRRLVDLLARDLLEVAVNGQRGDLRHPRDHGDVPTGAEHLP